MTQSIAIELNGGNVTIAAEPVDSLLFVVREQLKLYGAKRGCDYGGCGACTMIVNGKAVYSCMYPAIKADGKRVSTIEGLRRNGELHPLQRTFHENWAVQCGFCSPGMIMAAKALLDRNPEPDDAEIREALVGNLCTCTGYVKIVEAVREAGKLMSGRATAGHTAKAPA